MIEILRQFMPGDEVRLHTDDQFNNQIGTIKTLYGRSTDHKKGPLYAVDLKEPVDDEQQPFFFFGTEMSLPYYFQISDHEYIKVYADSQCATWNLIAQTNPAVPHTGRFIDRPLSPDHTCVATIHELPLPKTYLKKYLLLLKSNTVRNVQYALKTRPDPLNDNDWADFPSARVFLAVVDAQSPEQATEIGAGYTRTPPENIDAIELNNCHIERSYKTVN